MSSRTIAVVGRDGKQRWMGSNRPSLLNEPLVAPQIPGLPLAVTLPSLYYKWTLPHGHLWHSIPPQSLTGETTFLINYQLCTEIR